MAVVGKMPDHLLNGRRATTGGATVTHADDFQRLASHELLALYGQGRHPTSVRAVEGDPGGIAVGLHYLSGGLFEGWLRRKARSDRFVWHGKSFRAHSDHEGWGFNRLGVGPALTALPFRTTIAPSVFDGEPCIALDYGVSRNPRTIRKIWDELREVTPGVFIGPVMMRLGGRHVPVAWFGVDTTRQAPLIGA